MNKLISSSLKPMGIGYFAGFCGSLVGMGGGFIIIPLATRFLKLTQHQAHGTSLVSITATGISGAVGYASAQMVDFQTAGLMTATGMVTASLGAKLTGKFSQESLKAALGMFMMSMGVLVQIRQSKGTESQIDNTEKNEVNSEVSSPYKCLQILGIGCGSGLLAGFFGVGGGAITVPSLAVATNLDHKTILGTSMAAMVLPALSGCITHYRQGTALVSIGIPLAIGSSFGAFLGSKVISTIEDEERVKAIFSLLMVTLGMNNLRPQISSLIKSLGI
mmetsp:Transcript_28504/g.37287  ORF Transcript_28504/g.37287 Transcript_28504/m.37287 type:complete len:276 (-) Transcript_28504:120-947(-)